MNIPRNVLALLGAIAALFVVATAGAFAGAQLIEGNIRSFVVDIAQSVPVEVSAPIELESGEMVTVTTPITVNVELRVSVDGQGEAKVIEEAFQEPTITVSDTVIHESTDAVEIGNLEWHVTNQENLGAEFSWNEYSSYSTSGMFIRLLFDIENLGNEPMSLSEVEGRLVDERQRQFAEMDYNVAFEELCQYNSVNPGLTGSCVMVFDVPKDVRSLSLRLTREDETVEVPLTIVD